MTSMPTILLVDDDHDILQSLTRILSRKGYQVEAALTGAEALDRARQRAPAVALIDLRLQEMSGLDLMRQVKESCPGIQTIIGTGHTSKAAAIEATNLGAFAYVEKPYDIEHLLVTIRRAGEKQEAEETIAFQAALLQNISDAVIATDRDSRIRSWNRAAEQIYGWRADEVVGLPAVQVLQPDLSEESREQIRNQLLEEKVWKGELTQKHRDGRTIHMMTSVTLLQDREGEPSGIVAISHDITDRVQAEEERERLLDQVRTQAGRIQQIMDTVPQGVLLISGDGRVILANPTAERHLLPLADARTGDTLARLGDRPLAELLTSPQEGLWHEASAKGSTFELIARPIATAGEGEQWVLVVRDVTREREAEQQIQQQERLAAVGQLAAGIAHDFNNIMATIILYAQLSARDDELPERNRRRMETIRQQAMHASNLIQQILDFTRRTVLDRQILDLVPLLKEQVQLLRRTLPESIAVEMAFGADEYTINGDLTRMRQVIVNLALNARDAMPEGGELRIDLARVRFESQDVTPVREMPGGEWVRVSVSDTGTGISADTLPHIFDPFFTTKAPGEGTGLGLAQVHGIVTSHQGFVDVQTEIGGGTTFTVYLPALKAVRAHAAELGMDALVMGGGEVILVVEDNQDARSALAESLKLMRYQVVEAANGREALEVLDERGDEIALVLSDVVMPEMSGTTLLKEMRTRELQVPVVMLTGHMLGHELEGLRARGIADWIPKPPNLEQLSTVIARALNTTRSAEATTYQVPAIEKLRKQDRQDDQHR